MYRTLILSLCIVCIISIGGGFVLSDLIGFWKGVVGITLIQFILGYILTTFKSKSRNSREAEFIDNIDHLINLQTVDIICPCGTAVSKSPVFFNQDNEFLCKKCNSKFKVELSYDSILVTEPLNIENAFNFLKQKELL
jgi:Ca2+/Na+ antiporter